MLDVPEEMIHLFKAVKGYEGYLRMVWRDLYRAYGRECGDRTAACHHTKTAFATLGLPMPVDAELPAAAEVEDNRRKGRARTPETAYYLPILHVLTEMGGSGKTADVVRRVGEIMDKSLTLQDRQPLQSSGLPRWDNTTRFARHAMVRNGLLKANSPWGVWEISDRGVEHVKRSRSG